MANFIGTSGDDRFGGTAGADTYDISQGGEDAISSGAGDDTINAGGALDAGDRINGGTGNDTLVLDGDYSAGLVFAKNTMQNIETLSLVGGFDYDLTLSDGDFASLTQLNLSANVDVGDRVKIDASALASGHGLFMTADNGRDTVIGGAGDDSVNAYGGGSVDFNGGDGNDSFNVYRPLTRADHFNGGVGGVDQIDLFAGVDIKFTAAMMSHVRMLVTDGGDFNLTTVDANLAAGQILTVFGNGLTVGQHLAFNGSAERDGVFEFLGGADSDTLIGGHGADAFYAYGGDDVLTGGGGADTLSGGDGANTFVYLSTGDSNLKTGVDLITDLTSTDHIDLSAIDANTHKTGNQAFHLVSAFDHHAAELTLSYDAGTGLTTLAGDVNGDGVADLTVTITGDATGFTGLVL